MNYKKELLFPIIMLFFIIFLAVYVNIVKLQEPFNSIISFLLPVMFILNIITIGLININSSFTKKEEEIKKNMKRCRIQLYLKKLILNKKIY